jgi:hypothetical protein
MWVGRASDVIIPTSRVCMRVSSEGKEKREGE